MKRFLLAMVLAASLAACDDPQADVRRARADLKTFRAEPGRESELAVEQSLAKLSAQVDKLEAAGKSAEADHFRSILNDLRADFKGAKVARAINDARNAVQGFGEAMKDAGRSFEEALKGITNAPPQPSE